jgi:hypothetical protein
MEKKAENKGVYLELQATELDARFEEVEASEIFVVEAVSLAFAGEERNAFLKRYAEIREALSESGQLEGLSEDQVSFFVIKRMILNDGLSG